MVPSRPMPTVGFITLGWLILSGVWLTAVPAVAGHSTEPLNIVVTIPVLKDLSEQVGGRYVRVTSLLKGYENEHTYSPKPSDLVAVRNAQLLFEIGLGLEVWVAGLVKSAGRPSLTIVTTSKGIGL
ncbi:MAG TPA: zinc ABC transporter substrate-binding protein, partial [Nitrospira sp.]|nr:zinc ABC transporter substrate-binding protein [Nitrospira sp.]